MSQRGNQAVRFVLLLVPNFVNITGLNRVRVGSLLIAWIKYLIAGVLIVRGPLELG
jgi:hypothetical protein